MFFLQSCDLDGRADDIARSIERIRTGYGPADGDVGGVLLYVIQET